MISTIKIITVLSSATSINVMQHQTKLIFGIYI